MQIKVFAIPIPGGEQMNEEMNRFLRSVKVLQAESRLVVSGQGAFWCYSIKYLDDFASGVKQKIDYREVLSEEEFARFARMREIRKQLSKEQGVDAYIIFTDRELAELAKIEKLTSTAMRSVKGIGEKKVEKYGPHFINQPEDEKSK